MRSLKGTKMILVLTVAVFFTAGLLPMTALAEGGNSPLLMRARILGVVPDDSSSTITLIGGNAEVDDSVTAELDFTYFFIGASANFFDEIIPDGEEGMIPEEFTNLPLPKLNLGFRIPIPVGLWIDGYIGVEPTPLVRLTARYEF